MLILIIFSCGKNPSAPDNNNTIVSIASDKPFYNVGETIQVKVVIEKMDAPVFGFYCNIEYDSLILGFDDSAGLIEGDFLEDNAISFINDHDATITVTITSIQGETGVTGNGTAFSLNFNAISSGQTIIKFIPNELDFYDASGSIINYDNLELISSNIIIN